MKGIVLEPEGKPSMRSRPSKKITKEEEEEVLLGVFYTNGHPCVFKIKRDLAEKTIEDAADLMAMQVPKPILLRGSGCFIVNEELRSVAILDEEILLNDD